MTQRELKQKLYDLTGEYFNALKIQGNIVWGMTKPVNPNSPMVALTTGPINRNERRNRLYFDGIVVDRWPSKTMLQVDLFTKGAPTSDAPNVTAAYENTAVNDLTDFVNFLHSVYADHWSFLNDISLNVYGVQDLTAITNDTSWAYRAMVEIEVGFTQTAVGFTASNFEDGVPYHDNGRPMFDGEGYALDRDGNRIPAPPLPIGPDGRPVFPQYELTHSGGGSQELADQRLGWFEDVEIENKKEAPENGE